MCTALHRDVVAAVKATKAGLTRGQTTWANPRGGMSMCMDECDLDVIQFASLQDFVVVLTQDVPVKRI